MDSNVLEALRGDPVRQFAVFAENKVGRLYELIALLGRERIHPLALTTQDTTDSTIIRMVVDDPVHARQLLQRHGYAFTISELIAAELKGAHEIGLLLSVLMGAEINIHYTYPFLMRPRGNCAMALHLEDNDLAATVMADNQINVLTQSDISR